MKYIYCYIVLLLFISVTYAQNCNSGTLHKTYPALNSGYEEEITTSIVPGEYVSITNMQTDTYTFTSYLVSDHDYITIRRTSDDAIITEGNSPLNYTFLAGDIPDNDIKLIIHLDNTCDDTDNGNHTATLLNETNLPTCFEIENPKVSYLSNTRMDFHWEAPSSGNAPVGYEWEIGFPNFAPGTGNAEASVPPVVGANLSSAILSGDYRPELGATDYLKGIGHGAMSMGKYALSDFLRAGGYLSSLLGTEKNTDEVDRKIKAWMDLLPKFEEAPKTKEAQERMMEGSIPILQILAGLPLRPDVGLNMSYGEALGNALQGYEKLPKEARGILEGF